MVSNSVILCYRKIIDDRSGGWEKLLHSDTHEELKLQFQFFSTGNTYHLFSELVHADNRAEKLHFLVSAAAKGYIAQLNGKLPDIKNNLGKSFLTFSNYRFEIIESDTRNVNRHIIAINFFSNPLTWHATVGDYLLLSDNQADENRVLLHQLLLQPFLSIYSMQKL
ncbi:MAG: hypothetical protein KIT80_04700 [Chitinophagaceae bacterium]|nr:hypothetical protein [Chitinophagaceae bacterium]MCW5926191.1 hypothetical protein [Chitinophagaceae bacterium]